jgi:Gas vesicle protein
MSQVVHHNQASSLADVLDRVLDKGIVIAGDISISLVGVELLTIRLRLLVASVDKAKEMGISWWETDSFLTGNAKATQVENERLSARIAELEARFGIDDSAGLPAPSRKSQPSIARTMAGRRG